MDVRTIFQLASNKCIDEKVEQMILDNHHWQIVNDVPMIPVLFIEVGYSYKTKFGISKESVAYFVESSISPTPREMEAKLAEWLEESSKGSLSPKFAVKVNLAKTKSIGSVLIDNGAVIDGPLRKGGLKNISNILSFKTRKNFYDGSSDFKEDNIENTFAHKIHPKQVVCNMPNIKIVFSAMYYTYETQRIKKNGRISVSAQKDGVKYFVEMEGHSSLEKGKLLDQWKDRFNQEHPERELLNVKFLNNECLGYVDL